MGYTSHHRYTVTILMSPLPSDEPEMRDAWWLEVRNEVRSHMRAMGCNAVIGYSESTSIWWAQCLVSPPQTLYPVLYPRVWCPGSYSGSDTQYRYGVLIWSVDIQWSIQCQYPGSIPRKGEEEGGSQPHFEWSLRPQLEKLMGLVLIARIS